MQQADKEKKERPSQAKAIGTGTLKSSDLGDSLDIAKGGEAIKSLAKNRKKKKKIFKMIQSGQIHIQATYNNTIVTITDQNGNVISWSSAGKCGFKGPKKATPYAAGVIVRDACERATKERGLKEVNVFVKGIGAGREAAVRAIQAGGLTVLLLKDMTPIPHDGCRPPKVRRV